MSDNGLPSVTPTLSLSHQAKLLYRTLARNGPLRKDAAHLLVENTGGITTVNELAQLGLVQETPYGLTSVPRGRVIDDLLTEQAQVLRQAMDTVLSRQRQIRTLLDAREALDPDRHESVHTLTLHDDDGPGMYEPPSQASSELMALHPGGRFPQEVLEHSLHRAERSLEAGVRLRVVHQASALAHPSALGYLQAIEDLGGLVRVRQNLPFRMLIVDHNTAVCAAPSDDSDPGTFLIRGARILALLGRVFETTWVDSVPLQAMLTEKQSGFSSPAAASGPEDRVLERRFAALTPQQQVILRCLAEGETDQTIARRLGVTARTVSRRITEVYEVLQVDSRFQAGVAACRLGLV